MTSQERFVRLWPAVVIVTLQLAGMFVVPLLWPDAELPIGLLAMAAGGVLTLLWWLAASGTPWLERIGVVLLMAAAMVAMQWLAHISVAGAGQGMLLYFLPIPLMMWALVAWAAATRRVSARARLVALLAAVAVASLPFLVTRTAGVRGAGGLFDDVYWRWTPTPEERLLARGDEEPKPLPAPAPTPAETPAAPQPAPTSVAPPAPEAPTPQAPKEPQAPKAPTRSAEVLWPGFRGPHRDSVIPGVQINVDWSTSPPKELWRRAIGPGWSSFAVQGDLLYTQEQRGEEEIVACYRVSTGEPVWRHRDPVRFWESNGGPGPRATPALHDGRVYAMGATGIVNALDAATGAVLWWRNAATDTAKEVPFWGIASSPMPIGDLVVIAVDGRLIAYDAATGKQQWVGPSGGGGYSSPHVATLAGVPQILLQRGARTISVAPADGTLLWEHIWVPSASIVQPALTPDGGVLITTADAMGGQGMKRLALTHGASGWTVEERWTSRFLKPYFNDFVVHNGHIYGFDNSIMSSVNLETGERNWKGGRYGNGQLVLLPEQDLLLVMSEDGELVLVSATPDRHREIARFPALNGKTWNHPVLVRDVLLIRNGEEMAAFRLSLAEQTSR